MIDQLFHGINLVRVQVRLNSFRVWLHQILANVIFCQLAIVLKQELRTMIGLEISVIGVSPVLQD